LCTGSHHIRSHPIISDSNSIVSCQVCKKMGVEAWMKKTEWIRLCLESLQQLFLICNAYAVHRRNTVYAVPSVCPSVYHKLLLH